MENLDLINQDLHRIWPAWTAVAKIGEGSFGKVYRIVREGKFYSALKIIDIPTRNEDVSEMFAEGADAEAVYSHFRMLADQVRTEIELMESMKSAPHIVSIEDHAVVQTGSASWKIYIRMELLQSVGDYIRQTGPLSESEILKLSLDTCDGLKACHSNNIIHRDIKPGNIFRSRFGDYKIGDFGIARKLEGTMASTKAGTPAYEAPEVAKGLKYDKTADIYAVGMVLYVYMNRGRKPFLPLPPQTVSPMAAVEAQQKRFNGAALPKPADAPPLLSKIILKACAYQPKDRYQSVEELIEALEEYALSRKKTGKRDGYGKKKNPEDDSTIILRDRREEENGFDKKTRPVEFKAGPSEDKPGMNVRPNKPGIWKIMIGIAAGVAILVMGILIGGRMFKSGEPSGVRENGQTDGVDPVFFTQMPEETEPEEQIFLTSTPTPEESVTPILIQETPEPEIIILPTSPGEDSQSLFSTISTGDTITFGTYEQDNDPSEKEAIEWLVLAKEDNRALLVSKYGLDCQKYNEKSISVTWETCTLRTWLNSTFFTTAFTEEEQLKIPSVTIKNSDNPGYGTDGGNDTGDKIFLLSIGEVNQYFGSDEQRKCVPTDYAIAQGAWTSDKNSAGGRATCWWWLRSPGFGSYDAADVNIGGSVINNGLSVRHGEGAVRPALWIDLES